MNLLNFRRNILRIPTRITLRRRRSSMRRDLCRDKCKDGKQVRSLQQIQGRGRGTTEGSPGGKDLEGGGSRPKFVKRVGWGVLRNATANQRRYVLCQVQRCQGPFLQDPCLKSRLKLLRLHSPRDFHQLNDTSETRKNPTGSFSQGKSTGKDLISAVSLSNLAFPIFLSLFSASFGTVEWRERYENWTWGMKVRPRNLGTCMSRATIHHG